MIVLYTNDCQRCKILKNKLDTKQIQYEICDDIGMMADKFIQSVPVLEVDGKKLDYFKANTWVNNYKGEDISG
jgi:glutaredoxin